MGLSCETEDIDPIDGFADGYDSDNDGISDGNEIIEYFTNPKEIDSDSDGLLDRSEINEKDEFTYWYIEEGHDPFIDYDGDGLICLLDYDSDNECSLLVFIMLFTILFIEY